MEIQIHNPKLKILKLACMISSWTASQRKNIINILSSNHITGIFLYLSFKRLSKHLKRMPHPTDKYLHTCIYWKKAFWAIWFRYGVLDDLEFYNGTYRFLREPHPAWASNKEQLICHMSLKQEILSSNEKKIRCCKVSKRNRAHTTSLQQPQQMPGPSFVPVKIRCRNRYWVRKCTSSKKLYGTRIHECLSRKKLSIWSIKQLH